MKQDLVARAKEDGYDYGLVVRAIQESAPSQDAGFSLQDMLANGKMIVPSLVYKVYSDGHEELVRGVEIGLPSVRDLREMISSKETVTKNMLIAGGSGGLFSFGAMVPATLIAPKDILSPELEVHLKKSEAYPTLPVVARP
jgi:TldD protein